MKVNGFAFSHARAVLLLLGLTAVVAVLVVAGAYFRDDQRIDRWATANGYDVVSCQKVSDGILNFEERETWAIYQVVVKEKLTGQTTNAWIRLGPGLALKEAWRREDLGWPGG
jgi:hypothetical protein